MTSIDDLLSGDDEPVPSPARPKSLRRWVVTTLLFSALAAALLDVVLRASGYAVPFALAFMVFLALAVLRRAVVAVAPPKLVDPGSAVDDEVSYRVAPSDGLHTATLRWNNRLEWTRDEADRFNQTVRPVLVEIVDERLRLRHGVSRDADPARARQLLGDPLWGLLAGPVAKMPTPRQLADLVSRMEEL
ncbi:MAG TPA: hypothetical protein VF054_03075 [Micromonosporaceae bacterium]